MRRFALITAVQDGAATAAVLVILMTSEGNNAWIADIGRAVLFVLALPIGWLGMQMQVVSGLPFLISLPLAFLPNALLWAAVICWLLNRWERKRHSPEAGNVPSPR